MQEKKSESEMSERDIKYRNSLKKIIPVLKFVIRLAIEYGYTVSRSYTKEQAVNWLEEKTKTWDNYNNAYVKNNYFYSIIFNKDFGFAFIRGLKVLGYLDRLTDMPDKYGVESMVKHFFKNLAFTDNKIGYLSKLTRDENPNDEEDRKE